MEDNCKYSREDIVGDGRTRPTVLITQYFILMEDAREWIHQRIAHLLILKTEAVGTPRQCATYRESTD